MPVFSRYMTEIDDNHEERERKRLIHHEKYVKESLEREARFGNSTNNISNETLMSPVSPSSKSSLYISRFLDDSDDEGPGKKSTMSRWYYNPSKSSRLGNHKYLIE